jgi:uncharacterized protein DUF6048
MSAQSICRSIYILTISTMLIVSSTAVFAQADTTATDSTTVEKKVKKKDYAGHQLNLGTDIYHPIINHFLTDRYATEIAGDYYLHNEYYAAAEGGWGGDKVTYSDLKYSTTNSFFRVGFNKCVLNREGPHDWDMMFMGLRAAVADIHRSSATYTVLDTLWGNSSGAQNATTFQAYWAELTGGVRVAFLKNFFAGWNFRGKFLMNGKSFTLTAPLYIAGYGRGDKNSVFDFDVYVSYAIRWRRKSLGPIDEKTGMPLTPKPDIAPSDKKENNSKPEPGK